MSSINYNFNKYDLLNFTDNSNCQTNPIENSFIEFKLKSGSFILTHYMLRGRGSQYGIYHLLKNWKIEGQLKRDENQWILLDEHYNEPFQKLQIRIFPTNCNEELKAVRITQIGKNTSDDYYLCINTLELFGTLVK